MLPLPRPVYPQSTSETPNLQRRIVVGLKLPMLWKAGRVWPVDPTFPRQGKSGCEVRLMSPALNKEISAAGRRAVS